MALLMNVDKENPSEIEGTNVEIEGAGILDFELKGNTHQGSYTGKNFFNKYGDFTYGNNRHQTTLNELGQLVSTANFSSGRSSGLLIENLSQNTNYSFSGILISANGTGTKSNAVIEIMSTTSSVIYREQIAPSATKPYNFSFTFNTGSNTSLWVSLSGVNSTAEGTTETVFDNLQLEKGSATSYEPYTGGIPSPNPDYPQPIEVVTGDNTINVHGKNLIEGLLNDSSTGKELVKTINANENFYLYIKTTNTSTDRVYAFLDNINVGTIWVSNNDGILTFSGSRNFAFNRIKLQVGTTATENMLTMGNRATEYQPYQSKDYEISLGDIELCKIGNYQDYLYKDGDNWYIEKNTQTITLDGTETGWGNYTNGTTGLLTFRKQLNEIKSYTQSVNIICDHFVRSSSNATNGQFTNRYGNNQNLEFVYTNITSLDDFKIWLSTNNVKILFALTSPAITKITDDNLIEQLEEISNAGLYDEINYISLSSNNVIGEFKISYSTWYKFEKILRSGYNIKEDRDRITQKFTNGHRKQFLSDYKDCIITLTLDTSDLKTTKKYLDQLVSGYYKYYSLDDKEYKKAQFIIEQKPDLTIESFTDADANINEYQVTLLRAGD